MDSPRDPPPDLSLEDEEFELVEESTGLNNGLDQGLESASLMEQHQLS